MSSDDHIKALLAKQEKLGDNLYYSIRDSDGVIRPLAGLWTSDSYGKESAEQHARKNNSTVVVVRVEELK